MISYDFIIDAFFLDTNASIFEDKCVFYSHIDLLIFICFVEVTIVAISARQNCAGGFFVTLKLSQIVVENCFC